MIRFFLITLLIAFPLAAQILPLQDVEENVPFDANILNHPFPETKNNQTIYTPLQHKPYFKAERAVYNYYPRFQPSYVSFNPGGKAYIKYGTIIQFKNEQNQWDYIDVKPVIESYIHIHGWSNYSFYGYWGQVEEATIRFDNDGGAYLMYTITPKNSQGQVLAVLSILLHSKDNMVSWQVYTLPYCFARFEKIDGHNQDCLTRPPVILLSNTWDPANLYITVLQKLSNGTLQIPTPVQIGSNCISVGMHAGDGNIAITHGNEVYVVYGKLEALGTPANGVPTYVCTYNISNRTLSSPVFVGYGGIEIDSHNWPAITYDGNGILHIIINGHHNPFRYFYSLLPYSTQSWSSVQEVGAGNSYGTLNCNANNSLYVATRCSRRGYRFEIALSRKKTGQNWQSENYLVSPYKLYYQNWLQKMSYDPVSNRLFLTYFSQGGSVCVFKDDYLAYLNVWPHIEKDSLEYSSGELPLGTDRDYSNPRQYQYYYIPYSECCILVSDDNGDSWHLATSQDF
ncbi:MAG: hypothetical protein A2Y13_09250 [Planctomycetes bacterium GWC2_45_44]|nr:MAG: hypothetical protein A2Y13_09250 [Planctomycetes bacterium GWC2_45_44]